MITRTRAHTLKYVAARATFVVVALTFAALTAVSAQQAVFFQEQFKVGQTIAPAFEGWEPNPDGTINLVFGYFNRNWEEQPHVPVGPNNNIEPGGPDQGQPTRFLPRRNKFVFRVRVPKDFGNKELVWTLTTRGKTERAYASLKPDYKLDKRVLLTNTHMRLTATDYPEFDQDMKDDIAPVVRLEGAAQRTVKVREPVDLAAFVSDDGRLKAKPAPRGVDSDTTALGLRVAWFVYRGGGKVTFTPEQFKVYQDKTPGGNSPWTPGWAPPPLPADGMFPVKVSFDLPGTYVVRLLAHDGGLQTTADVTVTVTGNPATSASAR
jgi:hypothetical protein